MAARMTERELEDQVRKLIKDLGLKGFHVWQQHAQRADRGFPDWVIAGPGGHIFRELKRESESPSPRQEEWLALLAWGGGDVGVWRPSDLISGRIAAELIAISRYRQE
jgi:hypothetical protein